MSKLFHWNCMFPPVQLPVDNHAVSFTDASVLVFFLWALSCLCRDMESFSSVSCWSFFLPQWHLQCHLTSHHVNRHHFFHGKCPVKLFVCDSGWWMGSTLEQSGEDTPGYILSQMWLFVSFLPLSLSLCEQLQGRALVSVSPAVFPLQSVPWGSWTPAQMWKRRLLMPWYDNPSPSPQKKSTKHIASCHFVQLSLPGVCTCVCVCACVCVTNPWFYLCLMLSAVGRHAVQGQILLLLLTCMLYVCVSVRACV